MVGAGASRYNAEKEVGVSDYHKKEITAALAALLREESAGAFVIFEEKKTGKYVQFVGSATEPLLLDLPMVALSEDEKQRAPMILRQAGVRGAEAHPLYGDPTLLESTGTIEVFNLVLGQDVQSAAGIACGIFQHVYLFPPDFQLVIKCEPPARRESVLQRLRAWFSQ
jgi:hypothetical protein